MPALELAKRAVEDALSKRYSCYRNGYGYGDGYYDDDCSSAWNSYGRWILLAAIIVGFFLMFLLFSCITARRRRRLGAQPFYGTGWAAGNHGQPQYTNNQQTYYGPQPSVPSNQFNGNQGWQAPPPTYGQAGYYSGQPKPDGQQNGIELQQPNQAYQPQRGGDDVYSPPQGPPPAK